MKWARKRWPRRVLAAVLAFSMLPTLVMPVAGVTAEAQYGTYERWIRAQIRVPVDGAVKKAIAEAVEGEADSFDAFITSFLEAYSAAAPGEPISHIFTDRDLSNDALRSFLQRRYSQLADAGVVPRVHLTTFIQHAATSGDSGPLSAHSAARVAVNRATSLLMTLAECGVVISFRTLSSAQSLGP